MPLKTALALDLDLQLDHIDGHAEKPRDAVASLIQNFRHTRGLAAERQRPGLILQTRGHSADCSLTIIEEHDAVVLPVVPYDLGTPDELLFRDLQLEFRRDFDRLSKYEPRAGLGEIPHGAFHSREAVVVDNVPLKKSARALIGATLLNRIHRPPFICPAIWQQMPGLT